MDTKHGVELKRIKVSVSQLVERSVIIEVLATDADDAKARAIDAVAQLQDSDWGAVHVNNSPDYQTYLVRAL
jgi:hypothetical protein